MDSLDAADPRQIGDYRLLGRLGEGGMGSVYLAQSPRGRTVAVKLVRPDLAQQAEFRRRFEQEVQAARRVAGDWTAPVLDADTEAGLPWLATGYIPGIPLHDAVENHPEPLPERTVRILANRMALALGSVHDAGLVHRDVKPSNILVTIDGPRLIDFGIARALETVDDTRLTRTGAVVGSPAFMSPEQARGERLTAASDVFSLGSVLAFAATGRTPFGTERMAAHALLFRVAEDEPELSGVPAGLRELVAACLAKDPAARPTPAGLVARTADHGGEPGPGPVPGSGNGAAVEPWLPGALVAQLGRHAARLLDAEVPGAEEAAARAADAGGLPPGADAGQRVGVGSTEVVPDPNPGQGSFHGAYGAGAGAGSDPHGMRTVGTGAVHDGAGFGPPGPPIPPPPGGTPPPAAPRGTWRRPAVVAGAVGAALVMGAGVLIGVRMLGSGDEPPDVGPTTQPTSTAKGGLKPGPGGDLPKQYMGAWQSRAKPANGDRAMLVRYDIQQGYQGDVVGKAVVISEKDMCVGDAVLTSYDGVMKVEVAKAKSHTDGKSCRTREKQWLELDGGALTWNAPAERERARLTKDDGLGEMVTADAAGTWKPVGRAAKGDDDLRIVFDKGPIGSATMRFVGQGGDDGCEARMTLGAWRMDTVIYGGVARTKGGCKVRAASAKPLSVRVLSGRVEVRPLGDSDAEPVVLKPAD